MRETANGGAISVALHRSKCLFKSSRQWFLTISSGFPVLAWMILGEIVFYTWPIIMSYSCLAYDCFIHFFQRLTRSSNKVISMAKNNWSIWNRWKIRQTFWRERRKTKRFEKERYFKSEWKRLRFEWKLNDKLPSSQTWIEKCRRFGLFNRWFEQINLYYE